MTPPETTDTVAAPPPLIVRPHRVRLVDTDAARLIYYGAVFRWAEMMFTDWLVAAGRPLATNIETGIGFPAVRTEAEYLHPLGLDDEVELELRAKHVGERSFALETTGLLLPDRRTALRIRVWHTYVELVPHAGTTTPKIDVVPLPQWVRDALLGAGEATRQETARKPLRDDEETDTDISSSHRQAARGGPRDVEAPREQVT